MTDARAPHSDSSRALWKQDALALFAIGAPMALTQLVQFSINTIDVMMIGRLGAEALAGASLGLVIFFTGWLIVFGPAMAVSPLVSQSIGAGGDNKDDVRRSVRMSLWAILAIFPPLFVALLFATDIALFFGQPEGPARLAGPYVLALAPSIPLSLGILALRNFLAALGKTRVPLLIVIGTTLLNALLNYFLIFGSWGAPRLELVGAGLASSLANMAGFGALALYCRFDPAARPFAVFKDFLTPDWARFREVVQLGWPIAVSTAFEGMLFNSCVFLMGAIGVLQVAAYQVALNVAAIAFMAPLGFSMAGAVRVGLYSGARNAEGVRRSAILTVAFSIAAISLVAIPVFFAPTLIASFYLDPADVNNQEMLGLVVLFLKIAAAFMLFDAIQVAVLQSLRGLKDVRFPMIITGIAYWAIGFPMAAYLGLVSPVGAVGIWWGLLAALAAAALMLSLRLANRVAALRAAEKPSGVNQISALTGD